MGLRLAWAWQVSHMLSQPWPFCLWGFPVVSKGYCFLEVIHQLWLLQYFHSFIDNHSCAIWSRNKCILFMSEHLPISYSMHAGPTVDICIVYDLLQMRASMIRVKQYLNLWVLWKIIRSWFNVMSFSRITLVGYHQGVHQYRLGLLSRYGSKYGHYPVQ